MIKDPLVQMSLVQMGEVVLGVVQLGVVQTGMDPAALYRVCLFICEIADCLETTLSECASEKYGQLEMGSSDE